jgi:tetratricopeptide (TPR) repeat protein
MRDVLPPDEQVVEQEPGRQARRPFLRILGAGLIILAALLAYYLIVVYLGWQSGQSLLRENQASQVTAQLARQVELAREDMAQGHNALALRRLEWVLAQAPDYAEAQALQRQAQTALDALIMPQAPPVITATATPTPAPLPTPTPGLIEDPAAELRRIERLMTAEAWADAVSALATFQQQFPSYERPQTDALLYQAYMQLGWQLVRGENVELGLFYLEQAEKLGDLPQEALDYRYWAQLYTQGIGFYGVNWSAAAVYFRDLCLVAPFYQSSCARLYQALTAYGDQYAAMGEWCPAQALYEEARRYDSDQALLANLQAARQGCLSATPTPSAPITGTQPLTDTEPVDNPFFEPPEE